MNFQKNENLDNEISGKARPTEKYSVLMSLYIKENPKYLKQSIESMLEQSYMPDEIVIVKDGIITKELEMVLEKYELAYPEIFKIVGYKENRGLGQALNYGLQCCKNELVARMDTDDISKFDRCEKQVKAFELHPEYAIIGSAIDEFENDISNITGRRVVPATPEKIYEFSKKRSAFNHPAVMYKKSQVIKFGGYGNYRRNQDVDLFGRMIFGGCKAANFEESLLWFRSEKDLLKRRKSWENTKSYIDVIKKFYKMGYSSFNDVCVITCAQIIMYLVPLKVQKWLYKIFLRK